MKQSGNNYNSGKASETTSQSFLERLGFHRPSGQQRKTIVKAFDSVGKVVNGRGFDYVDQEILPFVDNLDLLKHNLDKVVLYEAKGISKTRKSKVGKDFKGTGFTLTENEKNNSLELGKQYRFLVYNEKTEDFLICPLEHLLKRARVYKTESVFITSGLLEEGVVLNVKRNATL